MSSTRIVFQQNRDLSAIINSTFAFMRQNFKSMFKSILNIAGPFVVIGAVLFGIAQSSMLSMITNPGGFAMDYILELGVGFLAILIGSVLLVCVVYQYIYLYAHSGEGDITVAHVWEGVKKVVWKVIRSYFALTFLAILLFGLLFGAGALIIQKGSIGIGFAIIFLVALPVAFYVIIAMSLFLNALLFENENMFGAIRRSFSLVRGYWWNTFVVLFITQMIVGVLMIGVMIPMYIAIFSVSMSSLQTGTQPDFSGMKVLMAVSYSLYIVLSFFASTLIFTACTFQYYALIERKESRGLLSKIDSLGSKPEVQVREDY